MNKRHVKIPLVGSFIGLNKGLPKKGIFRIGHRMFRKQGSLFGLAFYTSHDPNAWRMNHE
jgi:hypothetical protein